MKNILIVLFVLLCFNLKAQDTQGFFLNDWQPKSISSPAYTDTFQIIGRTTTTVSIDFADTVAKVSQYVYGNNGNPYSGKMNNDVTLLKYINDLNPHVIRWPGGNLSQEYFWNRSTRPSDIPAAVGFWGGVGSGQTNNDYYDLLSKTNSTGSICVNIAYARYGTSVDPIGTAAHYAAEWVRYDNGRSKFWELGNENFGSWEAGYRIDTTLNKDNQPAIIDGELYGNICSVFIDSMRAAAAETGADIWIGAVAMDQNVTYDAVQQHWNEQMMPILAGKADFIIVHSYYTPYEENSSVETILNSPTVTLEILNYINEGLSTAGYGPMPIALTEWNIFAVGSMQMVSYINGMQSALNIGELIRNKYGMAAKWDLSNGWGGTGDDHGMFAASDEIGVPYRTPHPQFHYMYFFQKYFGDRMVNSVVTGNSNVVAYSSAFSSGQAGIVLANKSRYEQKIGIDLQNFEAGNHIYFHVLTGGTDNGDFSRKVYINAQGPAIIAGGPANYATIKPWAINASDNIKLSLPPLSVVYALINPIDVPDIQQAKLINDTTILVKLTSAVQVPDTIKGFTITVNNSVNDSITSIIRDVIDSTMLILTLNDQIINTDTVSLSYIDGNFYSWDSISLLNAENIDVENLLIGSAPQVIEAYTDSLGAKVFIKFNKKMDTPPEGSFDLQVSFLDEHSVALNNASLLEGDSSVYSFTSAEPLYYDYRISLSWNDENITSADGGKLIANDTILVKNYCPLKPAAIIQAYTSTGGDSIFIVFDKDLQPTSNLTSKFIVTIDGAANILKKVTFPAGISNTVVLVVKNKIYAGDVDILVSYTGTNLLAWDDVPLETFNNRVIENLSTLILSGIGNNINDTFSVYPNPAKDELTIQSRKQFSSVDIYSVDGKKVYENKLNKATDNLTFSINLSKGVYIIKLAEGKYFGSLMLMID